MRSSKPLTRKRGARAWHFVRCVHTVRLERDMYRYVVKYRAWRKRNAWRLRARRLWAYYRSHPMPWCTWGPESGGDYRAINHSGSGAGGKYQIMPGTWYANGGGSYPYPPAAHAPPLEQERVARNVLASQGLGAWVNC